MRRQGFGWWRLAKQVVFGTAAQVVSTVQSTFSAASFAPTANGVATDVLTLTLKDANATAIPGRAATFSVHRTLIDAAACTVSTNTSTIEATTGTATITAYIYETTPEGHALPGIPAASLTLASTGTGNTITAVDTHTDQNGRFRWTFVSTVAEAKTLSLTACGLAITDTAAVTVSGGGAGLWSPDFLADWGNATGTGSSALRDGTVFDALSAGSADNGQVIAAPGGYGWNTTNVLQHYSVNALRAGWLEVQKNTLGVQAEGEVRNYRWAHVNIHPTASEGATDNSHHCVQDGYPSGAGSNQNWNITDATNYAGEWQPKFLMSNAAAGQYYLNSIATPTRLSKNVRYTFEIQITRGTTGAGTSNQYQVRVWVYDADGVELYGPADWVWDDPINANDGEAMSTTRWHTFNDVDSTQQFNIGCNGTSASSYPLSVGYFGEVAMVSSVSNGSLTTGTSIGAYGSCTGE